MGFVYIRGIKRPHWFTFSVSTWFIFLASSSGVQKESKSSAFFHRLFPIDQCAASTNEALLLCFNKKCA